MKKFLSILLAVMMVLSTVSFAAPSLAGSADTAVEAPVAEVPVFEEETADLAATAGDRSAYGKTVFLIDFEREGLVGWDGRHELDMATNAGAGERVANIASEYDSSIDKDLNLRWASLIHEATPCNDRVVNVGGNSYLTGTAASKWPQWRVLNWTPWGAGTYTMGDGIYTYALDLKIDVETSNLNPVDATGATVVDAWGATTDWDTFAFSYELKDGAAIPNNAGAYFSLADAGATVCVDNVALYYRPATVTLTIDGNEYEVSTSEPVTAASLASKVKAPTGYVLSGLSLTEGGEAFTEKYFFEDTVLYPTYKVDDTIDVRYGKKIASFSFNDASKFSTELCNDEYHQFSVANVADYNDASHNLAVLQYYVPYTGVPSFTNGYSESSVTGWGSINLVTHSGYTYNEGIYTIAFDLATNATTGFAITQSSSAFTLLDGYSFTDSNTFDHVVIQVNKDYLAGRNNLQIQFSQAQSVLKVDNLEVFYRPNTVDVTLVYNGEEYVAENVATTGISADTILAAAGVEVPYGKKAVLSATNGGESVGNVVTPVIDSTYYVSFVDDDSITEFGKRLLLVDFENFEVGAVAPDNKPIAESTSNFNGDWGHLTINYEVGANAIVEQDGNKFIKGQQGWAQIRINNANFESAPAGYYTMALSEMNFGDDSKYLATKDQDAGVTATWVKGGSVVGTQENYPVVNGVWNDVASELDHATKDFTIYHTAAMTTDVGFDNIALYYRPASVNLTVVGIDGEETVYENCDSVVDIDTLLADVTVPFGYKAALSIEKNGDPISGSINLVSDAKLYVVLVEDETVSMEYGKALYIIDFEREDMQGWAGTTIDVANSGVSNGAYVSTTASYYNDIFENKNYRVRSVVNEGSLTDQKTVVDENGNHYTTGTATTNWPQVYQTNYGKVQYKAGYYTFVVDSKISEAPVDGHGFGAWTKPEGFSIPVNEWYTITGTQELTADGNLPGGGVWFNYSFTDDQIAGNVTVSWDNAKLYYKPYTAKVELAANGEVVATKENVSTAGVLVSELVDGVKVKGYSITGVKLGATVYGLEDTIKVPCDCQLELALEEQEFNPATPETSAEKSIRASGDPSGIRFKASLTKTDMADTTEYGWIVTREELLNNAGIAAADFTLESSVKMSKGWNYGNGTDVAKIFEQDDEYAWFTAVLYFSATEDDGLPSADKLAGKLVARPFAKNGDEYLYGEPTAPASMYDVAYAIWSDGEAWGELDGDAQTYLDNLMIKVEDAGLGN